MSEYGKGTNTELTTSLFSFCVTYKKEYNMNSKLTQAGLPTIETEDFIELTLVDECGDENVTSIDAPPVDDMTTTVLRETEETQVLTDIPKIVLKTVPSHSA